MEKVPDIKSRLGQAGMKKRNTSGWYYEVHFEIGMTFDNDSKLYLTFDGNRFQIEAKDLGSEFRPAISN